MADTTVKVVKFDQKRNDMINVSKELLHFLSRGVSGTDISAGTFTEEYLNTLTSTEAADVYDEMRRSDSQIKMLLRIVKSPVISASWGVEAVDDSDEEQFIRDFIEHVLIEDIGNPTTGKYKTWSEFIQEAMSCVEFGYSMFEVVNKVVLNHELYGDYIGIKDLGWRSPRTIEEWILRCDGSIDYVRQITEGDLYRDVNIFGENIIIISPHKEGDNYEGISDLRPIYGNWFRKNYLNKLQMIGIERSATGVPKAIIPSGQINSPEQAALEDILKAFVSHQKNYILQPEGWELDNFSTSHDAEHVKDAIVQEDVRMSKAFLANFLELGLSGKGGSFALGTDLSDIFFASVNFYPDRIREVVDRRVIRPLVNAKFGKRQKYPKTVVSGINDKAGKEFAEILKNMSEADLIQSSDKLKAFVHRTYKLPDFVEDQEESESNMEFSEFELSEIQSLIFDKSKFTADQARKWLEKNKFKHSKIDETENSFRFRQKDPNLFDRFRTKRFKPGINAVIGFTGDDIKLAEFKPVNISKFIRDQSKILYEHMTNGLSIRADQYVDDVMGVILNTNKSQIRNEVKKIKVPGSQIYRSSLQSAFAPLINKSTNDVLRELGFSTSFKFNDIDDLKSIVPSAAKQGANEQAKLLVDAQDADLMKQVLFTVNSKLESLNDDQMSKQLREITKAYITGPALRAAAGNSVSTLVNLARNAVFQTKAVFDEIESFVFTNPDPVAAVCVNLAGRVFTKEEYLTTNNLPPLHHNCDSYIVAQRTGKKRIKPISPLGLTYTGTDNQIEAILKSKKF
jgi:succinate dehydrogenase flavin-adding protein (antitoxin of CptAB toxin-antitoxin module)